MESVSRSREVALDITVRFAETDMMDVVHHSAYVVWFEAGRVAWLEAMGMPYAQISAAGYNFAVTEVNARYRTPVRFGEPVRLITRLRALRSRQIDFQYEVRHGERDELHATGYSRHICVDDHGHMTRIPTWVIQVLQEGGGPE